MINDNLTLFGEDNPTNKTKQESFSYSKIALFLECPLRYKYAYKDHLRHKYQNTFYLNVGRNIHNTFKSFFAFVDSNNRNSENLIKLLRYYWKESDFKSSDESYYWFETVENSLKNYLNIDRAYCYKIETLEEQYFKFELDKNLLDGKIDRIDMISRNEIELIDYKTGDFSGNTEENIKADLQWIFYFLGSTHIVIKKKSKEQEEKDDQIRSYLGEIATRKANPSIFVKILNKELKPSKITFYYIVANKKISFCPDYTEIKNATDNILRVINQIKTTKVFKAKPNKECNSCSFYKSCNFK